jgi:hypothetical protein
MATDGSPLRRLGLSGRESGEVNGLPPSNKEAPSLARGSNARWKLLTLPRHELSAVLSVPDGVGQHAIDALSKSCCCSSVRQAMAGLGKKALA